MPRKGRALHAHRILLDPGENGELAEKIARIAHLPLFREQVVDPAKQALRLCHRLVLQRLGHQRCGCGRDCATRAVETDVPDDAAVDVDVDEELVAAHRVEAVGGVIRALGLPRIVSRVAVVIEDDFLVEIAEVVHRSKISFTLYRLSTSASMSARVLYSASEAREVAGTLYRRISGIAQ